MKCKDCKWCKKMPKSDRANYRCFLNPPELHRITIRQKHFTITENLEWVTPIVQPDNFCSKFEPKLDKPSDKE